MANPGLVGQLKKMAATQVSPMLISTITDEVIEELPPSQQRPVETLYPIVYFDALRLKIRDEALTGSSGAART